MKENIESQQPFQESGNPKISINIFYGHHLTGKDIEGLSKAFAKADIYIPEFWTWRDRELQEYRSMANGVIEPKDVIGVMSPTEGMPSFYYMQLKMIYNSKKPITIIDVSMIDAINDFPNLISPDGIYIKGTFNEALEAKRQMIKRWANANSKREDYMLSHLAPKIQELLREYPLLREKEEVNVLLFLGASHTRLYHKLKRSGQEVIRKFNETPFIYDFGSEGTRRHTFGREVDDLLAARIILHELFGNSFERLLQERILNSEKRSSLGRKIVSQFSFEEAKEIFERLKKGEKARQIFETKFTEKGIQLPQNEKELEAFLAKPLPRSNAMHE